MLGEREAHPLADDEVIEHADVDQRQRLLQAPRDELVRLARLEHARGVLGCISGCNRHLFPLGSSLTVPHT
jgi:hypothetical protein